MSVVVGVIVVRVMILRPVTICGGNRFRRCEHEAASLPLRANQIVGQAADHASRAA